MKDLHKPPVILLGGSSNCLSIARSLGRNGVKVYSLNSPYEYIRYSRYAEFIPLSVDQELEASWTRYLLSPKSDPLKGSVLLACCDSGLEVLINNRENLAKKYILDESNNEAQRLLLSKLSTYEKAVEAGIPTPKFWKAASIEQVSRHEKDFVYPLLIKPYFSHRGRRALKTKFLVADSYDDLMRKLETVFAMDINILLLEMIPGPDDRLCSYYTYIDENGAPLFDFTKRIIRRYPANIGGGCLHITDWNPEARELGLRLFQHVGLRGLGNVEFKRDSRDGKLKVIDCNARFTEGNCLVTESGFDLALFVYNRLTGKPYKFPASYRKNIRLWYPNEDFRSYLELRKKGELTFFSWISSIFHFPVLPYFKWYDPYPTIASIARRIFKKIQSKMFGTGRGS